VVETKDQKEPKDRERTNREGDSATKSRRRNLKKRTRSSRRNSRDGEGGNLLRGNPQEAGR